MIGTPDDAIAQIQRLWRPVRGGFGTFLVMAHEWADPDATSRATSCSPATCSPRFQGSAGLDDARRDWAAENRPTFIGDVGAAIMTEIGKHNAEHEGATGAAGVPAGGS